MARRHRRWFAGLTLALVTTVSAAGAQAPPEPPRPAAPAETGPAVSKREPTAGDLATARGALRDGLALREKGDLQGALTRLGSAYDLVPTPVTGFELGKTHLMLGHVLQAHELFKKVVRMQPSLEESARSQAARDESGRLAREIEPRIPSLRIRVTLPPGATAVVRIDDEIVPTTGPETVRAVDPGRHEVAAKAGDGPEEKVEVQVAEAETKDVPLAPRWVPPQKLAPGAPTRDSFVKSTNPLVYIGFGVAATAVVVSAVTAVVSANALEDARERCGKEFCPPRTGTRLGPTDANVGDLNFTSASDAAAAFALVSIIAGITAGVFLGVGIVGIRTPIKERVISNVTVKPSLGRGGVGLSGTF
jgi:hypothetical protein